VLLSLINYISNLIFLKDAGLSY